ncbi:hypothetical protein C9374_008956 [Naegleria lovaniensis]|uniref:RING-type domain-containing protein n=1 Tax=Naegleria lovaniensis TaxID=51637 RepID=A0AA88GK19_NAELO|nr:uncharacterized protein C9374_008956 [Naegleria lovaniensis]KAG2377871.1 hypothetical protein C9374_008956 [Naegleria lovaniensis]
MTKHSKNASCRVFYSNQEKDRLRQGTQQSRLGSESMRPFDACCLCNQPVYKPAVSKSGFLYCYECILENLVQQKKENERKKLEMEEKEIEEQIKQIKESEEKQYLQLERKLDILQNSVVSSASSSTNSTPISSSSTPTSEINKKKKKKIKKLKTTDPMNPKETLKMKDLVRVNFKLTTKAEEEGELIPEFNVRYECPCCFKVFNNACKGAYVVRECGHVMCVTCFDKFCKDSNECFVCQGKVKKKPIRLVCANLGFAHNDEHRESVVATTWTPTMNIS